MGFDGIALDALQLESMKSGHLALNLTSMVGWNAFPLYVNRLLALLGGSVLSKNDSVDIRVWEVAFAGVAVLCVYDDYPQMVSIESRDVGGDAVLRDFVIRLGRLG